MASSVFKHVHLIPCYLRVTLSSSKVCASSFMTSCVYSRKHYNPKFKKERQEKFLKITLPDFDEARKEEKMSVEEMRTKSKEKGIAPSRTWEEKPMVITSSGDVFDQYVPPPGDGKISSLISSKAVTEMYDRFGKKSKSYLALRKIRKIDYDFDVPTVAEKAKEVYIEAQKALAEKDDEKLYDLATDKAIPEMTENVKNKTISWNFIQCLEPPRIVHIRVEDMLSKSNVFAQITVRLHTQQTLAVYDRFGRLMHGSESTVKDVLEYVVFEKQITNPYGSWKIHGKIIPDWMPSRESINKTYVAPDVDKEFPEPPEDEPPKGEEAKEKTDEPAIATA